LRRWKGRRQQAQRDKISPREEYLFLNHIFLLFFCLFLFKVDQLILDIVGRESAAIKGLPVADSEYEPTEYESQFDPTVKRLKLEKDEEDNEVTIEDDWEGNDLGYKSFDKDKDFAALLQQRGMKIPAGFIN
jgi:hypothetical protein